MHDLRPRSVLPRTALLVLSLVLTAVAGARAQEAAPPPPLPATAGLEGVPIRPAAGPIQIDGRLDDAGWEGAAVIELPYEFLPGDNVPAPVRTECRVAYDADNLYLACTAYDPDPSRIRASYADRDRALGDDHIVFLIDPFADRRRAFQFRVNPLGVQMDAFFMQDSEDFSWDAIWSSAGRITAEGYVVEAAIPFRSLRFPRTAEVQTWGIIIDRSYPRSTRHRIRSVRTERGSSCLLCQAALLTGMQGISPGRDVEISPTLTASRADARSSLPAGEMVAGDARTEPGVNLRWGITSNMTFNATINPDFSQVEADVAQLSVNERFALSYPEKRPFFLDGAEVFQTFVPVVFTRQVVEPRAGFKVTGREGANTLGAFAARDRFTSLVLPTNERSRTVLLDAETTTGVVRYLRDVGQSSTVGVVYTGRTGEGYANHAAGVDALLRLPGRNTLRAQVVGSRTEYPLELAQASGQPEGEFGGTVAVVHLDHNSRNWNAFGQLQSVGTGYRSDAGFLRRVDARVVRGNVQRVFWGQRGSWYNRLAFTAFAEHLTRQDGTLTDQAASLGFHYGGPRQSTVSGSAIRTRRLWNGEMFDLAEVSSGIEVQPGRSTTLRFSGRYGTDVDLANTREARLVVAAPAAEFRLGRHLKLDLSHRHQRLSTLGGERILNADLAVGRLVYNFNTRTFVRAMVQYQDVRRNPDAYAQPVQPQERRFSNQLLFSYKVNPQTVMFVGYSESLLGLEEFDLLREDRAFFLKLGYAWRL